MRRLTAILTLFAASTALAGCSANTGRESAAVQPANALPASSSLKLAQAVPTLNPLEPVSTDSSQVRLVHEASQPGEVDRKGVSSALLAKLPALPEDSAVFSVKAASATHVLALDSAYLDSGNTTPTPSLLTLTAPDKNVSWAVFQIPVSTELPNQLTYGGQITFAANGANSGLWIGLANYAQGIWNLNGPLNVTPSVSLPIPLGNNFKSPAGNMYVLVLAWDEDVIELNKLQLTATNIIPPLLPDEFGLALSTIGLNENSIGMDQIFAGIPGPDYSLWGFAGYQDLFTTMQTYFSAWYVNPAAFPAFVESKGEAIGATQSVQDLFLQAADELQVEHQIDEQSHSETLDPAQPLAKAIADLVSAAGGTPDQASYDTAVGALDLADQDALAVVVESERQALLDRNQTIDDYNANTWSGGLDLSTLDGWFASTHGAWLSNSSYVPLVYDVSSNFRFLRSFPYEGFFVPAARLADAVDALTAYIATAPSWEDVNLDVDTPAGRITIGGTGDDTHAAGGANGHLLLIDLGGSDTYNCHAGGTASFTNGVSLCIDLAGNDIYNRLDDPALPDRTVTPCDDNTSQQGAARYGIGMLVDYSGNDEYYSVRMSQGSAVMGVGILADFGGNDLYANEALCLGAAYGGVGICFDADGDDQYNTWAMSGGFGGIMGVGMLVDQGSGTDDYYAEPVKNDAKPEYASGDDPLRNANFCFGASLGKPQSGDSATDPVVGAGGFGFCYDGGGNDTYTSGYFGQGCGFYESAGILFDVDGSDGHTGEAFSQAAAYFAAVSALWDGGGNDTYNNLASVGIGAGSLISISWLLERAGDDTYNGSDLTMARGHGNSNAFLVDWLGIDTYHPTGADGLNSTLGRGGDPFSGLETAPTIGVLVDVAGNDNYDATYANMLSGIDASTVISPTPADQVTWVRDNGNPAAGHGFYALGKGVGYDGQ